jgi:hypothetical protein
MKKTLPLTMALLLTAGCASNIKQLGKIGDTTYYKVHSRSFDGPNSTVLMGLRDGEKTPQPVTSVGGPGIGAAIIGAGGNVAAATVFGMSIRPDRNSSTVNVNSANANQFSSNRHNRVDNGHDHDEGKHHDKDSHGKKDRD